MASLESKTEYNELVLCFLSKTEDNGYKLHWYYWDDRSNLSEYSSGLFYADNLFEEEGEEYHIDNLEYFYDKKDSIEKVRITDADEYTIIFRANCRLQGIVPVLFHGQFGNRGNNYIKFLEAV